MTGTGPIVAATDQHAVDVLGQLFNTVRHATGARTTNHVSDARKYLYGTSRRAKLRDVNENAELEGRDVKLYLGIAKEAPGAATDRSCRMSVSIERDEYDAIAEAMRAVRSVGQNAPLGLVRKSYRELTKLRSYYQGLFEKRRPKNRLVGARDAAFILMWACLNWLAAFRLYVDHEPTLFRRRYGHDSAEVKALLDSMSAAFDRSRAYRVVSKFRNYVQHCGLPISRVQASAVDDVRQLSRIDFTVGRDTLLDDHGGVWGATVRTDLQAMPEDIDILLLIDDAMAEVDRISNVALSIRLQDVFASLSVLRDANERIGSHDGYGILAAVEYVDSENLSTSTMPVLGTVDIDRLARAQEEADPVEYLRGEGMLGFEVEGDEESETPFAMHRALAVLGAWFEGGGLGDPLDQAVAAIVDDDAGNSFPLLMELVGVAAVALNMAALAAGSSPEALLGSFATPP